jgi:hypothetical protein
MSDKLFKDVELFCGHNQSLCSKTLKELFWGFGGDFVVWHVAP